MLAAACMTSFTGRRPAPRLKGERSTGREGRVRRSRHETARRPSAAARLSWSAIAACARPREPPLAPRSPHRPARRDPVVDRRRQQLHDPDGRRLQRALRGQLRLHGRDDPDPDRGRGGRGAGRRVGPRGRPRRQRATAATTTDARARPAAALRPSPTPPARVAPVLDLAHLLSLPARRAGLPGVERGRQLGRDAPGVAAAIRDRPLPGRPAVRVPLLRAAALPLQPLPLRPGQPRGSARDLLPRVRRRARPRRSLDAHRDRPDRRAATAGRRPRPPSEWWHVNYVGP